MIYYLRDGRVRGALLWNVWEQVDAARRLIAEPGPFRPEILKGRCPPDPKPTPDSNRFRSAEREGFDVLVTTDRHLRYQQALGARRIAIIVLNSTSWPRIQREIAAVIRAVDGASERSYTEVQIP